MNGISEDEIMEALDSLQGELTETEWNADEQIDNNGCDGTCSDGCAYSCEGNCGPPTPCGSTCAGNCYND